MKKKKVLSEDKQKNDSTGDDIRINYPGSDH